MIRMKQKKLFQSKKAFFQIAKILWHLDIFRRSFRELSGHACLRESCIFCALKDLFSRLQFSQESPLPPDTLRRVLIERFPDYQRFQLGLMDDAAECFENILLHIHLHVASGEPEDMCNAKYCIPHQKFAMTLVEQSVCGACGATSEPLPFTQMVHYISASALTSQIRQSLLGEKSSSDLFGQLLKYAGGMGDIRDCPSTCGAKIQICRTLMNRPEIVSVGIVWDSEKPSLEHIMDVFTTIGTCLRLIDVFHSIVDSKWGTSTIHNLVGLVTYSGKHYSTFFFHTKLKVWIYFDDTTVKEIGQHWDQVVDRCRRGRYQPLLLLYAIPCGTPVNAENAPKTVSLFQNGNSFLQSSPTSNMRRSVTPSPEKPIAHDIMRRAVTPNPDSPPHTYTQRKIYNDYQNLSDIQSNIFNGQSVNSHIFGETDSTYISRRTVENVMQQQKNHQKQLSPNLSSGTAITQDGISISDNQNVPRRRDSGNWSGDRNSASSSSSTTMENPYLYIINKMQRNYVIPKSPTNKVREASNGITSHYDAGYDSYSLSSNDSLPLQHNLKHTLQLAQIPEAYQPSTGDDCERLCKETDELLDKSRAAEDAGDLGTAVALCNAANSKARAAMDAPYNNPHTMTIARMKHNTCVMRSRSLHRRILQEQVVTDKGTEVGIFEGKLASWENNKLVQHSRQNSKDKGHHSRQNSRELVNTSMLIEKPVTKSIEIYATLPKKKNHRTKITSANVIEDEEYMLDDRITQRTGLFTRMKKCDHDKKEKKRARSEERNKNMLKDFSIAPVTSNYSKSSIKPVDKIKEIAKDIRGNDNKNNQDDSYSSIDRKSKKQHKIRRKLIMGGLIKRKNRSMPDLRENSDSQSAINQQTSNCIQKQSIDDSTVGLKGKNNTGASLSGYLSEGHLEFTNHLNIHGGNPNLERSRFMRKSSHGSVGKILHAAKVPPPPPLRTTSQLSESKGITDIRTEQQTKEMNHITTNGTYVIDSAVNQQVVDQHWNHTNSSNFYSIVNQNNEKYNHSSEPQSLPSFPSFDEIDGKSPSISNQRIYNNKAGMKDDVIKYANGNLHEMILVVTHADIHNEQSPDKSPIEILPPYPANPNIVSHSRQSSEDLPPPPPPYPVIHTAGMHSRQTSEDFPPPPSPLEVENTGLQSIPSFELNSPQYIAGSSTQSELKGSEILASSQSLQEWQSPPLSRACDDGRDESPSSDVWLKELQEIHTQREMRGMKPLDGQQVPKSIAKRTSDLMINTLGQTPAQIFSHDVIDYPRALSSVRDMAAKFERIKLQSTSTNDMENNKSLNVSLSTDNIEAAHKIQSKLLESPNNMDSEMENSREYSNVKISNNPTNSFKSNSPQITAAITASSLASQNSGLDVQVFSMPLTLAHENGLPVDHPEDDISQVAMQNTIQNTTILPNEGDIAPRKLRNGTVGKKKSVSFCDQVVLVATAEDDEKDSYFSNPILERVLRSAMNKPETVSVLREIQRLEETENSRENSSSIKFQHQTVVPLKTEAHGGTATPFQDQLRSVNPITTHVSCTARPSSLTRQNSHESIDSTACTHDTNHQSNSTSSPRITHTTVPQQQIRYSQNGLTSYSYHSSGSHHGHASTHLLGSPRNQGIKPPSPFTIQQPSLYGNYQNNGYSVLDQLEQHNQFNMHLTAHKQLENGSYQRNIHNHSSSPIPVQQLLPAVSCSTNPSQQAGGHDHFYHNNLHTTSLNQQQLPQYQPPPNPVLHNQSTVSHEIKLSQQLQITGQNIHLSPPPPQNLEQHDQKNLNYQQQVKNYQRSREQINEPHVLAPNQTYPNSLQSTHAKANVKYPNYHHSSMMKPTKQIHLQTNGKSQNSSMIQSVSSLQRSAGFSTPSANPKTVPCNLCRKRNITETAVYCSDCDFYMSRFRPKN